MRRMKQLATALIVLAFVAGPPSAAAVWLIEHPWQPPRLDDVRSWLERPRTLGDILAGVAVIVTIFWATITGYLVRHGWQRVLLRRHRRQFRPLTLPTPAQITASSMAGVAVLTLPLDADHHDRTPTSSTPPPTSTTSTPRPWPQHPVPRPGSTCPAAGGCPTAPPPP